MKSGGVVFAIKPFSMHDGPNLRTTVFLKGCPLRCRWCHNPEGLHVDSLVVHDREKCIECGTCLEVCPHGALGSVNLGQNEKLGRCQLCLTCVDACPALARQSTGVQVTVPEVMAQLLKDLPFYEESGGGVTFSGGEPLFQPEFLKALLEGCGNHSIHRAVDTSCFADRRVVESIAEHTDLFMVDLKHMSEEAHQEAVGVGVATIHENIRMLVQMDKKIRLRFPLIPEFNDGDENIRETAAFVEALESVTRIDVLPYHQTGSRKYQKLGLQYAGSDIGIPDQQKITAVVEAFRLRGLEVQVGG
ncbi:MAG: glycyl-radical enzyme activating protein [Desulfobulbaceae bacterium]|nr:MAG: glycyl-radical enzyme activating protein [Desulfobulbaceae bacterium]